MKEAQVVNDANIGFWFGCIPIVQKMLGTLGKKVKELKSGRGQSINIKPNDHSIFKGLIGFE